MKIISILYRKNILDEYIIYDFSSADETNISNSNLSCSEDEDLIFESNSKK